MKQIKCNTCKETTYILECDETHVQDSSKETPLQHLKRTGHAPRERAGERRACLDCYNVWRYGGDADRPTCPECKGKRTEPAGYEPTEEQVELLKTVPHLQEQVEDDTARTFVLACQEIREEYLSGAASDLEYVATQLKEAGPDE